MPDIDPSEHADLGADHHARQTDGTPIVNRQNARPVAAVAQLSLAPGVEPAMHRTRTRLTN